MKKIQILGTGCAKCKKLAQLVEDSVRSSAMDCEIEKVTEIQKIMEFGVMTTPALVVDGVVKSSGKVPSIEEITRLMA